MNLPKKMSEVDFENLTEEMMIAIYRQDPTFALDITAHPDYNPHDDPSLDFAVHQEDVEMFEDEDDEDDEPPTKGKTTAQDSAEFKESEHPRDDDGKFGSGGGSGTNKGESSKTESIQSKGESSNATQPEAGSKEAKEAHSKEINAVKAQHKGKESFMKAPNGKPTKLNERQWLQVRTPSFKAWFGDWENDAVNASKVVDDNGEPLVLYHGSWSDIENFIPQEGFYGKGVYLAFEPETAEGYGGNIYPVFVNVKTKLEKVKMQDPDAPSTELEKKDGWLTKFGGYLVVKNDTQIKSAISNTGGFKSESNKIMDELNK